MSTGTLTIREVLLLNLWRVVLELRNTFFPVEEKNSLDTVGAEFLRIIRIEFDPMLILELLSVFELKRNNWSFFLLVGPVPKRNSLWLIITKSYEILVVN